MSNQEPLSTVAVTVLQHDDTNKFSGKRGGTATGLAPRWLQVRTCLTVQPHLEPIWFVDCDCIAVELSGVLCGDVAL